MRNKLISVLVSLAMIVTIILPTTVIALTDYDLTINEALSPPDYKSAEINGAFWEVYRPDGSTGTGVFDPFLRVQKTGVEKGYNTNASAPFDAKSGTWTHALLLKDVPVATKSVSATTQVGAAVQKYSGYEVLLDMNESASNPNMYLDMFQIYLTDDPMLNTYDYATKSFPAGDAYKVWDLGENRIHLDYAVNTGSGGGDYRVLIPKSYFDAALLASGLTASTAYMVLFVKQSDADSGFEEWGIKVCASGNLKLIKVDQNQMPVTGAVFEISSTSDFSDAMVIGTTDSNGFILADGLTTGTYYIREKSAPAGYIKSNDVKTITITKDTLTTVSFTNTEVGDLKLIKIDQFQNKIPGAVFEISKTSDFASFSTLGTTDSNGTIDATGMNAGTYYIREKSAPAGYVKSNEVKMVTIDKDLLATVYFMNIEIGDLKVIKMDQFERFVMGVVFEISDTSDFANPTVLGTTNASGEILVTGMKAGAYYIREKSVPSGYVMSTEVKMVTIDKDLLATVYFMNVEVGGLKIIKIDQFENLILGAVFEISETSDFANVQIAGTTNAQGEIVLSGIKSGTYYVREKSAPTGYIKSTEVKMVTISKDLLATVFFTNTETGDMKLIKIDQFEHRVVGAIFEISKTSDFTDFMVLGTTDSNGEIVVTGAVAGTYYIREKTAPAGYIKSNEVKMVTIDKDVLATVYFKNVETGDLKLIKIDQFEHRVVGAIFEISKTSDFTEFMVLGTTNSNGEIVVTGTVSGKYYIREKSAPAGYIKSDEVKMITISKDVVATVWFNNVEIGDIKIVKIDQFENPLPGAVFELSKTVDFANPTSLGTTDNLGVITVTGIVAGTYYVREKTAPAGYIKSTEVKMVTIDKDLVATVWFNNTEIGDLKIIKIDQFQQRVPGVVFEMSKLADFSNPVVLGTSNNSGEVVVTGLEAGSYYVREKTVPAGYTKSTEVKMVTIDKDLVATVWFTNKEIGNLEIIKINQFESPVAGAIFEISKTGDFLDAMVIGTTDTEGHIHITGMDAGGYFIREKSAPLGYVKSNETKMVTIDKDVLARVYFSNTQIGNLKIVKIDQFENPVAGAVFELSKTSDFANPTNLGMTDNNGFIIVTGLVSGTYFVRETIGPFGYVKSNEVKMVTISNALVATVYFVNTEIGDMKIVKVDQFQRPVPGATFEASTTSNFANPTSLGMTDSNGFILVNGLSAGVYYVREKAAPAGYVKTNEDPIKMVTIDKDALATVYFMNIEIGDLKIIKVDQFEHRVPGVVFELSASINFTTIEVFGPTDSNGEILETGLSAGTYYIREKTVPAGYIKSNEVKMVTIDKDMVAVVYFMNIEIGDLKIVKLDQNENAVQGAIFEISDTDNFEEFETVGPSDNNGAILLTGMEAGTYYVREKTAPDGYIKSDEVQMVTIDKDTVAVVYFMNTEIGDMHLIKVDQFQMPVPGAVFEISKYSDFDDATVLGTTNNDGHIMVTGLHAGTYYVREVSAPLGYLKSDETKMVTIDKDEVAMVYFTNAEIGDMKIIKIDQFENPIAGAVFELSTTSDFEDATQLGMTDSEGFILVTGLHAGTYFVREVAGPLGYIKSNEVKTVTIDKDMVATVMFINVEIGDLKIVKLDQNEQELPGAVFEISQTESFDEFETVGPSDNDGIVLLTGMVAGTYYVREKTAPAGYIKSDEVQMVTIDKDIVATVYFLNIEIGDLELIKVDQFQMPVPGAVFEISNNQDFEDSTVLGTTDIDGHILATGIRAGTYYIREVSAPLGYTKSDEVKMVTIDKDELATVSYVNTQIGDLRIIKVDQLERRVPGAVFEISSTEDFAVVVEAGTTDAEGMILMTGLVAGRYYVREKTAPAGFTKSNEVSAVDINMNEVAEVTFLNLKNPTLRIIKRDAATEANLAGAVFGIYEDFEGTILVNNTEYTTDENGVIEVVLDDGVYFVRENQAPIGYKLDPTPVEITITDGILQELIFLDALDETEPQTGTNDYTLLIFGLMLLAAGLVLLGAYRKTSKQ